MRKPRLTEQQWKALRLVRDWRHTDRFRATWIDAADRSLGPVTEPFEYHPAAYGVRLARLAGEDADTFKGDRAAATRLRMSELLALAPCWIEPLQSLSPLGEKLAGAAWEPPQPPVGASFKVPRDLDHWITEQSQAQGRSRSALILQAITEYRSRTQ